MAYPIIFYYRIPNSTLEHVFHVLEDWLSEEEAKVKQRVSPSFIEASHGTFWRLTGWGRDSKKTLAFQLTQRRSTVTVRVIITPSNTFGIDIQFREGKAKANWAELLSAPWTRSGGPSTIKSYLGPDPILKASKRKGFIIIYVSTVLLALIGVLPSFGGYTNLLAIPGVTLMILGILEIRAAY